MPTQLDDLPSSTPSTDGTCAVQQSLAANECGGLVHGGLGDVGHLFAEALLAVRLAQGPHLGGRAGRHDGALAVVVRALAGLLQQPAGLSDARDETIVLSPGGGVL